MQRRKLDQQTRRRKETLKAIVLLGACALFFVEALKGGCSDLRYIYNGIKTGSWNLRQQRVIIEQQRKEYTERQKLFETNWNKLFGQRGYADIDHDGILSFQEKVKAWQAMGYTNRLYDSTKDELSGVPDQNVSFSATFPRPDEQKLEKAIKFYELVRE